MSVSNIKVALSIHMCSLNWTNCVTVIRWKRDLMRLRFRNQISWYLKQLSDHVVTDVNRYIVKMLNINQNFIQM